MDLHVNCHVLQNPFGNLRGVVDLTSGTRFSG